jgi:hypothetical protein
MRPFAFLSLIGLLAADEAPFFASGIKVGEVDQNSAIIWARLTEKDSAKFDQLPIFTEGLEKKDKDKIDMPLGVVPGMKGEARVGHRATGVKTAIQYSPWKPIKAETDFSHQFRLTDLLPGHHYELIVEGRKNKDSKVASKITGGFHTAPEGKSDNHANKAFFHEGQELRDFLAPMKNTYVICGDRHWQYCSKDPGTGLIELGCGPINDQHQYGGNPGKAPMHRYFSAKGGFLGITVENGKAKAEWFNTNDGAVKVGHIEKL